MRVSHYFEWEGQITGGHHQSVLNQRAILDARGIEYTTDPDLSADLLHLNNMGPKSLYYASRARAKGVPVVIHAHQTAADFEDSFAFSNAVAPLLRPYLEFAYDLADVLVCPSEHNRAVVEGYVDRPTRVVSNGFDPAKVEGHESLRAEYLERYDLDPPVVFNVGHVIERKGLSAFVETARAMPAVDFAWFGYLNPTGDTLGKFLQSSDAKRIVESAPDNCTFTGYVEDIRGAYGAGDVFFFPTHNENEGMALLEAMAAGAPPVVRDIPTFSWLADGEEAVRVDTGGNGSGGDDGLDPDPEADAAAFAEPLRRLVEDAEERARIGENARERSREFTLEAVGEDLLAVYEDVLAGRV